MLLTERMRMKADDKIDGVAFDVADKGFVAARRNGHRLRDAREFETLEEADGEVTVSANKVLDDFNGRSFAR